MILPACSSLGLRDFLNHRCCLCKHHWRGPLPTLISTTPSECIETFITTCKTAIKVMTLATFASCSYISLQRKVWVCSYASSSPTSPLSFFGSSIFQLLQVFNPLIQLGVVFNKLMHQRNIKDGLFQRGIVMALLLL